MIRVLMFRPKEKFQPLNVEGVSVENVPLTQIFYNKIDADSIKNKHFDYVIFTSSIAVDSFKSQFKNYEDFLNGSDVIAIGTKTAEAIGIKSTVPDIHSSRGILDVVKGNSNILLIRSENGNPYLLKKLRERARNLVVINAYRSVVLGDDFSHIFNKLRNNSYDAVIFTSSMIFNSYIKIFSQYGNPLDILPRIVMAIGEETAKSMKRFNLNPVVLDVPEVQLGVEKIVSLIKKYS